MDYPDFPEFIWHYVNIAAFGFLIMIGLALAVHLIEKWQAHHKTKKGEQVKMTLAEFFGQRVEIYMTDGAKIGPGSFADIPKYVELTDCVLPHGTLYVMDDDDGQRRFVMAAHVAYIKRVS